MLQQQITNNHTAVVCVFKHYSLCTFNDSFDTGLTDLYKVQHTKVKKRIKYAHLHFDLNE